MEEGTVVDSANVDVLMEGGGGDFPMGGGGGDVLMGGGGGDVPMGGAEVSSCGLRNISRVAVHCI